MKVLLIGSGAREHAIGWKLAQSPRVTELLSLPGNPGLATLGAVIEGVDPTDAGAVAAIARIHNIDLVVVGPEAPLAAGVVDAMNGVGIRAFGPTRAAARLESSKAFAKEVMGRAKVPTPAADAFTDVDAAHRHIDGRPGPYVVKADGLAAGKGVLVTESREKAHDWVVRCLTGDLGGEGAVVVVEDFVAGPELSVFAVCDGTKAILCEPARDYKRVRDGDQGPNTGGMGSYSPVDVPPDLLDNVASDVIQPVLDVMRQDGTPYVGVLYAGLILGQSGPSVIEFNCRFGDPETQAVLARLETDLVDLFERAVDGNLQGADLTWSNETVVNVVLASEGYPQKPRTGDPISGVESSQAIVFHGGTSLDGTKLVTSGGRVLSVLGRAKDLESARQDAYAAVEKIRFKGRQYRSDIGL